MSQEFKPKRPDWTVSALDKSSDRLKGQVGVAWDQDNGTIRIKLNPFVRLDTSTQDLFITLFPIDGADHADRPSRQTKGKAKPRSQAEERDDAGGLPF